jgi:hypothetical protein
MSRYIKEEGVVPKLQPRDNQVVLTFWTCLQLERYVILDPKTRLAISLTRRSDIIAELPVPASNILTYEDDMYSPDFGSLREIAAAEGLDWAVFESYSAQLYLRKHLNELHGNFYNSSATCKWSPRTDTSA